MLSRKWLWLIVILLWGNRTFAEDTLLVIIQGYAQGTTYDIRYLDKDRRNFKVQVDSLLKSIDRALSTYNPDSEISVFNRSHAIRFRSPYFYPVLEKSREVYLRSGGLFDPTVMPLVEAYGFGPGGRKQGIRVNPDSLLQWVGFDKIEFDSVSLRKSLENVRLDFNAIAQGYSVDVIADFLNGRGIQHYLIEVGGELRARGHKLHGEQWVVGISDPLKPARLRAKVRIGDRGMATSGNYRNYYEKDGVLYNHIINPLTGLPGRGEILSVSVLAPDAMTADAYATAFMLMGVEKTKLLLKSLDGLDVYLVYALKDGGTATYISEGLRPFLTESE